MVGRVIASQIPSASTLRRARDCLIANILRNAHSTFEANAVQNVSQDDHQVHFSLNFETNLTEQLRSVFTPSQVCNCFGPQTAHRPFLWSSEHSPTRGSLHVVFDRQGRPALTHQQR